MKRTEDIKLHDKIAGEYDSMAKKYRSYIHEILFGMCFEYIKPGDSLLDLGIGTGLSSILFARMGLNITGLDGSEKMLKECRKKGIAKELKQYNIQELPLPYPDNLFSQIICCGVLHSFGDLLPLTEEVYRILKPGGIFALTVLLLTAKTAGLNNKNIPDYMEFSSSWDVSCFKHSEKYINKIARKLSFIIQKKQKVLSTSSEKDNDDVLFKIIVMQKQKNKN